MNWGITSDSFFYPAVGYDVIVIYCPEMCSPYFFYEWLPIKLVILIFTTIFFYKTLFLNETAG